MKTDLMKQTIEAYDRSAKEFADHFQNYAEEKFTQVDQAFELVGDPSRARVVEIGCGTGKHAIYISKKVAWYQGFDPSEKMIEISRAYVPGASFVKSDALGYEYPDNVDVVFAFASLLHLDKDDFASVCQKVAKALRPGGVFCMTLKEADEYKEELQEDEFGQRQFFFYNPTLVADLAGPQFELALEEHYILGKKQKRWCTVILKRTNV